MAPARYVDDHGRFDQLQTQLNEGLALFAYRVNNEGKLATGAKAKPLSEAAEARR